MESESIKNFMVKAENISKDLKEAGEVISDGLSIAMPPNFKPFTMVITWKKKTMTFSEFKVFKKLRRNRVYVLPSR